ncbi:unnamed protein product [Rotaria socialis]|uniref:Uncharacterized protein n=1 Tax=Rotaria socialis TaxID=392032 RepID=A0A820SYV8_9BILA|nr:unnamed protein product [Rotaria socialis]CAF3543810.1 unnamed protein product [Rotaria socialis]CAF3644188.1 unnamed protein product [Rotaria socialis]CAF4457683.1 unnamed protein product [Rotaria socialis]CAF4484988.1 unnamed protein product [Rotaria socialis]
MSNNRVYTVSGGSIDIVGGRGVSADFVLGTPQATGTLAWVQNTYASQYNHAVGCWEAFDGASKKRRMRGGHLLLYRWLIFAVVIVSFVLGGLSKQVKAYIAFPIVATVIYMSLTIWNWHVFRINGSLRHPHMIQVPARILPGWSNKFFRIPIYAQITDRQILGITHEVGTIIAQLIQQSHGETSLHIMAYTDSYLRKLKFPKETVLHFLIFIIVFIVAIGSVLSE